MQTKLLALFFTGSILVSASANAQDNPDFSGAWSSYRADLQGAFAAPRSEPPQYNSLAQQYIDDYQAVIAGTDYAAGNACVGSGMPGSMLGSGGYPMEIIQRPDQLFVIYEAHNEIRRFYLGDEAGDPNKFFRERNGYATAEWDEERLIVDTTRLKTQVDTRYPHSNQATIHEEYYLAEPLEDGTRILVAELTMTDPLWLEEPWSTTKYWQEMDDYHVLTYECSEPKWLDEMELLYEAKGLDMIQE